MSDLNQMEAELNRERESLAQSLDHLTSALAPDQLASKLSSSVEGYGGEIGRQAWHAAKQNPAAFALVAAGIGLLLTGSGTPDTRKAQSAANDPLSAMDGFDARVAKADTAMKSDMATKSAAPKASWLRDSVESGLDALPASARSRVVKARQAAVRAQERFEAQASDLARKSRGFHRDQPMVVGALAAGFGALVASLLPSTRQENALLGDHRDAMMDKARMALRTEMANLSESAKSSARAAMNTTTPPPRKAQAGRGR